MTYYFCFPQIFSGFQLIRTEENLLTCDQLNACLKDINEKKIAFTYKLTYTFYQSLFNVKID
ncbi:hypothetical protein BpHYR1_001251 [Brachionus plicatilis]|uniref:Uncharacterized protein n=1 Tax=Brachionus plicatilis TaxID=10195 RepID=A0A3M7S5J9_BRAPC|nr:hypothetical protein BpHYR1_001251 [Brachionus plicatilis]